MVNSSAYILNFYSNPSIKGCQPCVQKFSKESSSFTLRLDGFHQGDPPGRGAASCFSLSQVGPHGAPDVHRAVVLVRLRGDLHLLDDELQEAVLLLQNARHLFHPARKYHFVLYVILNYR